MIPKYSPFFAFYKASFFRLVPRQVFFSTQYAITQDVHMHYMA